MAQLVAHLLCKQRVAGSNPLGIASTVNPNGEKAVWAFFISEDDEIVRNPVRDYWH